MSDFNVTADQLRSYVERYEQLESEKKATNDLQKDVLAEAKATGYDTATIRQIVALRKLTPDDLAEKEAILDIYKQALGMA